MADRTLYMVLSNAVDGMDDEFNDWYDNVHVKDVLAVEGLISAQRYKLRADAPEKLADGNTGHKYLCIYEMEGDVADVMGRITQAVTDGKMVMSPALDLPSVTMTFWEADGPKLGKG